jgi:hypothetical protein
VNSLTPPEVAGNVLIRPAHLTQVKWSSPVTTRVLIEGAGYHFYQVHVFDRSPGSRRPDGFPNRRITTIMSPLDGTPMTLYNLAPEKRGLIDNIITFAPGNSEVFNGVDILVNGRFGAGGVLSGGLSMGRSVTDNCTVDDPNMERFCKVTPPFMAGNQYKFLAAYPLPYGVQVSGTFQSTPGPLISANYTVSSGIAGVPLTLGSVGVNLVEPGTLYERRSNRVDLRVGRDFRIRAARLQPYVDLLNIFNASPVLTLNNTFGPAWQQPLTILVGRMIKVGMQVDF